MVNYITIVSLQHLGSATLRHIVYKVMHVLLLAASVGQSNVIWLTFLWIVYALTLN